MRAESAPSLYAHAAGRSESFGRPVTPPIARRNPFGGGGTMAADLESTTRLQSRSPSPSLRSPMPPLPSAVATDPGTAADAAPWNEPHPRATPAPDLRVVPQRPRTVEAAEVASHVDAPLDPETEPTVEDPVYGRNTPAQSQRITSRPIIHRPRGGIAPDKDLEFELPDSEEGFDIEVDGDDDVTLGEVDAVTEDGEAALFLKQNGQIYVVRDWVTLRRWIYERRVDEHDLVSEGGVRWEPVANRADCAALFVADDGERAAPAAVSNVPFPFQAVAPSFATPVSAAWTDDDTQGVPTGLPPLPNEHSDPADFAPMTLAMPSPRGASPRDSEPPPEAETMVIHAPTDRRAPPAHDEPEPLMAQVEMLQASPSRGRRASTPTPASGRWEDLLAHEPAAESGSASVSWDASALEPFEFDDEWDDVPPRRSRVPALAGLGLALGCAGLLGFVLLGGPEAGLGPLFSSASPSVGLEPPGADRPDVAAPQAQPEPMIERSPAAAAPSAERAPARAAASPALAAVAAAPAPPPVEQLLDRGWSQVESDPAAARSAFEQVLEREPSHEDAVYGYGYSLLMQHHPDAAKYLCRARKAKDPEVRQDAVGLIASHALRCP